MEVATHGDETTQAAETSQVGEQQEATQVEAADWQKAIRERDGRIAELEAQVAEAVLADHDGDMAALKEAEPWLFSDDPAGSQKAGTTGLPNAGTSTDNRKTMARWRRLAGLDDEQ